MFEPIKVSFHSIIQDEEEMIGQHIRFLLRMARHIGYPVEFVIVDGGSKDSTLDIIGEYSNDERFKIYENPWPGFAAQRNFAIDKSRGEWTFLIDADVTFSNSIYNKINGLLNAGNDVVTYSFPKIHLVNDSKHMYNKSLDPTIFLFRNIPGIHFRGSGVEGWYFKEIPIFQHPASFNFPWQRYDHEVIAIHFAELKSFEQKVQKCLRYSAIGNNRWFGMTEKSIREKLKEATFSLNPVTKMDIDQTIVCPISERFKDLQFYTEFN